MAQQGNPQLIDDFSGGVLRNTSRYKRPIETTPSAVNFVFDENVGEAQLRKGTAMVGGAQLVDTKSVLGLFNLRRRGDTNHRLLATINDSGDANSDVFRLS